MAYEGFRKRAAAFRWFRACFIAIVGLTVSFGSIRGFGWPSDTLNAAQAARPSLAGQVTSQEEGRMEGVVVTARKDGSTITVSVVSDKRGHFAFPADRLEPGHYTLKIRAVGYDLDGAAATTVVAGKTTTADLNLRKTRNIAAQLTNAEWMLSIPGTEEQKSALLNCNMCHTLERIVRSTHSADEFTQVIARMRGYASVTIPIKPQRLMDAGRSENPEQYRKEAEYLASINLSSVSQWEYPLKTLPRPTGRSTRVIVTEYDLPRPTVQPHDVIVDKHGMVWYTDFGEQFLGRVAPATGKVTEFPIPEVKPGYPVGSIDLHEDKDGSIWIAMLFQGAVAHFDPSTEKFQIYGLPPELNDNVAQIGSLSGPPVNGKLWATNVGHRGIFRLDLATGKFEGFQPLKELPGKGPYQIYGITSDSHNNCYFTEFQTNLIGRIDGETGAVTYYPTPTLHSRPRRLEFDSQDRLWFAEYLGNKVGLLDPKTKEITEWPLPTPWTGPYYVTHDKNGELWTGGMTTDRVVRVNTANGQSVEYMMPKETNIRRVFVDNSTTPVTFWAGSNHGAAIVKVEPLD